MNFVRDVITYVRRLVKTSANNLLTDNLIIDYLNRFILMDVLPRMELFDLKQERTFQTNPGINKYNVPLYSSQTSESSNPQAQIAPFPMYQGFMGPVYINGLKGGFMTEPQTFYNYFPYYNQSQPEAATGDGSTTTFSINLNASPCIPGHIDITGIQYTGNNIDPIFDSSLQTIPVNSVTPGIFITYKDAKGQLQVFTDSGQFLSTATDGKLYGLLLKQGKAPFGNTSLGTYSTTQNTVCYNDGTLNITFPSAPPDQEPIQVQSYYYQQGLSRGILFYNNVLTISPPPDKAYTIKLQGYLTPAAFLTTSKALPFGYMAEYFARGAARKILSDTGDIDQFNFYEPLFKEQEFLVWKRNSRIRASTQAPTIYNSPDNQIQTNNSLGVT